MKFAWDQKKEATNRQTHDVDFETAKLAFNDPHRVILADEKHSVKEARLFCFGMVKARVLTVRFTMREGVCRIIGAGYWRTGKKIYEKENRKT